MTALPPLSCGSCTACCHSAPYLDDGEQNPLAKREREWNPVRLVWQFRFPSQTNGSCAFRGETGCTVYDSRPNVCKRFDCRVFWVEHSRKDRRRLSKTGEVEQAVWDAANSRRVKP